MSTNYLDLIGPKSNHRSIHNFVNYKKVPVEVVIEEAQALIYSQMRIREMRASATVTLALAASTAALPTGYLEAIAMQDREGWNVFPDNYISEGDLLRKRTYTSGVLDTGLPMHVAIFGELFQFECKADAARTFDLVFFKTPDLLSASNTTNFMTSRYPNILRIACQAGAASFMKDSEEFQAREAELFALITAANAESDLGKAA